MEQNMIVTNLVAKATSPLPLPMQAVLKNLPAVEVPEDSQDKSAKRAVRSETTFIFDIHIHLQLWLHYHLRASFACVLMNIHNRLFVLGKYCNSRLSECGFTTV